MSNAPNTPENRPAAVHPTVMEDEAPGLTRSYAEALLGASEKEGQVDAVLAELEELVEDVWRGQPQFSRMMISPSVSQDRRDQILIEAFEGRALPIIVRFLRVMNRHGRLSLLPAVVRRAREEWDRRQNRVPVLVKSADPLDEGQMAGLHQAVGRLTAGQEPILRLEIDPGLIGGLIVQVGDQVYDASVRRRLQDVRRRLFEAKARELQAHRESFTVSS